MPYKSWLEASYKSRCPKVLRNSTSKNVTVRESDLRILFFFGFLKTYDEMMKINLKINGSTEDLLERGAQDGQQRRRHDEPSVHCRASRHSDGGWMPSLGTIARH